jgi:hypothetical protein
MSGSAGLALNAPVRNIVSSLVYAGSGHEVKRLLVAGKILVRDGEALVADEVASRAEAKAEETAQRVAADPLIGRWRCWRRWKRGSCEKPQSASEFAETCAARL